MSSCAGYHTPIEDEVVTSIIIEGDVVSELPSDNGIYTGRSGSLMYNQVMHFIKFFFIVVIKFRKT